MLVEKEHEEQLHSIINTLDEKDVVILGIALGLFLPRCLARMSGGSVHKGIIHDWLVGEDNAHATADPTWQALAKGLMKIRRPHLVEEIKDSKKRHCSIVSDINFVYVCRISE